VEVRVAPALSIQLLGGFYAAVSGTPLIRLNTPRLQALLAYLALHRGTPQSRRQLAYLFWPDSTDDQARTNLRNLLHRLRAALGAADAYLSMGPHEVTWLDAGNVTLDVAEFESALQHAQAAERSGDEAAGIAALERAAKLYQGELLPDCYDEWVHQERARLRQLALEALERLVGMLERRRDYAGALAHARRLLAFDPLREMTTFALMRLYAAQGEPASALRAYHAYATSLHTDLSAAPGPALQAAYQRLVAAQGAVVEPVAALPPRAPLVGRQAPWARLEAVWEAAAAGRPRLLTLAGEAGIGKTRLAEEFVAWAGRLGAATAQAQCYAGEGELAYAPVVDWMRSPVLQRRLARLEPVWLTEITRLMPEWLAEQPGLAQPPALTQPWQRQRLFEALARGALGGDRPLLLLLDNLQWCDQDSLDWVHFLLRYRPRARLLLVSTVRIEETSAEHGLAALLADLRRGDQVTEIQLQPLSLAETGALAGHLAGRAFSAHQEAELHAETEGNPLFVVETVRARLAGQPPTHAGSLALPASVQAVIARRLALITPRARALLDVAAVIGRSFTLGVLARAAEAGEPELVQALDELWQRRLVREQGAEAYDFSHDKVRAVAYAELSVVRRRYLHRRVAQALEAGGTEALDAVSGQIAAHYEQAGLAEQAAAFYERAAEVAERLYALVEAVDHLRRALALIGPVGASTARLRERLGDLLHLAGRHDEAREAYQRALSSLAGDDRLARARLLLKTAAAWRTQYRYGEAFAATQAAEDELGPLSEQSPAEHWQAWVAVQVARFWLHYYLGQAPEMFQVIAVIRPVVERGGTAAQRTLLQFLTAHATYRHERYRLSNVALGYTRAYVAAVQASNDIGVGLAISFTLGFALLFHGNLDEAEPELQTALATAERTGDVLLEARCLTYLCLLNRHRQQTETVRGLTERALRVCQAAGLAEYLGAALGNLAWLAWRAGNLTEAQARGREALEQWRQIQMPYAFKWLALWPLLGVALAQGQAAEAVEHARALLDVTQQALPEAIAAGLEAAVRSADAGDMEAARLALKGIRGPAVALGYL
jgi:DNA-binding SARP family transcriptional activator